MIFAISIASSAVDFFFFAGEVFSLIKCFV